MPQISRLILDSWLNYNIRHFCFEGLRGHARTNAVHQAITTPPLLRPPMIVGDSRSIFRDDGRNQCAHFVSHVLGVTNSHFQGLDGSPFSHTIVNNYRELCRQSFRTIENLDEFCSTTQDVIKLIYVYGRERGERDIGFYYNGNIWHYENQKIKRVVRYGIHDQGFTNRYSQSSLSSSDLPRSVRPRHFRRVFTSIQERTYRFRQIADRRGNRLSWAGRR
jgi:hypothetical protein